MVPVVTISYILSKVRHVSDCRHVCLAHVGQHCIAQVPIECSYGAISWDHTKMIIIPSAMPKLVQCTMLHRTIVQRTTRNVDDNHLHPP